MLDCEAEQLVARCQAECGSASQSHSLSGNECVVGCAQSAFGAEERSSKLPSKPRSVHVLEPVKDVEPGMNSSRTQRLHNAEAVLAEAKAKIEAARALADARVEALAAQVKKLAAEAMQDDNEAAKRRAAAHEAVAARETSEAVTSSMPSSRTSLYHHRRHQSGTSSDASSQSDVPSQSVRLLDAIG